MITSSQGIDVLLFILIGFSLGALVTWIFFYIKKRSGKVQQSNRRSDNKPSLEMNRNLFLSCSGNSNSFLPSPNVGESFIDIKSIDTIADSNDEILFWKDQSMPEELPVSSKMIDKYLENNETSDEAESVKFTSKSLETTKTLSQISSLSTKEDKCTPEFNSIKGKSAATISYSRENGIAGPISAITADRIERNESSAKKASRLSTVNYSSIESRRSVSFAPTASKKKVRNDSKKSVLGLDSKDESSDEDDIPLGLRRVSVLK